MSKDRKPYNPGVRLALGAILPALGLLGWHLASLRARAVIPSIQDVVDVLLHPRRLPANLDSGSLLHNTLVSMVRVLAGFVLATAVAVPVGVLTGRSRTVRAVVSPLTEAARPISPIAWLPVAIVVFGLSSVGTIFWGTGAYRHDLASEIKLATIFVVCWAVFFPIVVNTAAGAATVRTVYVEAAATLGATRWQMLTKVIIPAALPSILTGLRLGIGRAWMVIIAAEIFPGTTAGLGYMISVSHQVSEYQYTFAAIIVIGGIGVAINSIMTAATRSFTQWAGRER